VIYLFATVCVLLAFLGWTLHAARQERLALINRLIARTPGEVRLLEADPTPAPKPRVLHDDELEYLNFGEPVGI
jgi:hypothetical protein